MDWVDECREGLKGALEELRAGSQLGRVELFEMAAGQLSRAVAKEKPWTWRYVQGVEAGTVEPSAVFARAVRALCAGLDGMPPAGRDVEAVKVLARPGNVRPGSVVLGKSRTCERVGCRVMYVPNVPWRRFCSEECAREARRKR